MATTETIVNGTGSNGDLNSPLSFSFAYLKIEDVKVELQQFKVSNSKVKATFTPTFTIDPNQPTQVILSAINAATDYQNQNGTLKQYFGDGSDTNLIVRARIYRLTGTDTTPATFVNGTSIRAKDLNDNFDQFLFTMQERQSQIEAIETGVIADGAVDTAELADDAVTADKLSDSASNDGLRAVTTDHIRDNAVTTDKLAHDITIHNNLTVSNNLTVTNAATFNGNINIDGSSLKLKFRDSGGINDALLYSDGTDFRLELKDAINDFKIFDGTTLRYTFADNGNLTCTGSVTATSFVGNADTATTATAATAARRNTFTGDGTWKDITAWNATDDTNDGLANATGTIDVEGTPVEQYVQINGKGKLRASNDIETAGDLIGTLGSSQVRNAIALGNEGQKGTYAFCTLVNNTADRAAGYEAAGSDLRYSNADATANGTPPGQWRLMGRLAGNASDSSTQETSLWLRIS